MKLPFFDWHLVRASHLDQIKADAEKAIEHHRRREWKMGEAIANIAWRLGLCHSLSPDVKAAWNTRKDGQ